MCWCITPRAHTLLHCQVSDDIRLSKDDDDDMKVKALEFIAPVGERMFVKVTEVTPEGSGGSGFRVHGSMRVVSQADGTDLDPTGKMAGHRAGGPSGPLSDELPEVNSVHKGIVKRIEPYGVFVQLEGYRKFGLVHASQVSNYLDFGPEDTDEDKRRGIGEVVAVGDPVYVKVVEVSEDPSGRGPRIGCSIKLVNQSSGEDLDPQALRYRPRGEAGGPGGKQRGAIGSDAATVVEGGKIDWGYMRADTKQYGAGSGQYNMLADEHDQDGDNPPGPSRTAPPAVQLPPAGRGRGAVVPAWMTQQQAVAPGSTTAVADRAPAIGSVEEALAILKAAQSKSKHKHRHKKEKHKKDKDKGKKHKHKEHHKKHKRSASPSSASE
eukprot:jgi/Chrzof1/1681/Cz10g17030.t1